MSEVGGTIVDSIRMNRARETKFVIRSATRSPELVGKKKERIARTAIRQLGIIIL